VGGIIGCIKFEKSYKKIITTNGSETDGVVEERS
jgi:hypothetical protein